MLGAKGICLIGEQEEAKQLHIQRRLHKWYGQQLVNATIQATYVHDRQGFQEQPTVSSVGARRVVTEPARGRPV